MRPKTRTQNPGLEFLNPEVFLISTKVVLLVISFGTMPKALLIRKRSIDICGHIPLDIPISTPVAIPLIN